MSNQATSLERTRIPSPVYMNEAAAVTKKKLIVFGWIKLYDNKKTLFYRDPPYVHSTRGDRKAYGFEMR
jgi:hypothetical protein